MKKKLVSNHYIQACLHGVIQQGFDPQPLLDKAAIPIELMHKPKARITEVQLANLIRAVWRTTGDEFMGLTEHPCNNGVFALMMESLFQLKTLGAMLQQSIRFYNAVQNEVDFAMTIEADQVDISITLRRPEFDPDHLLQEFVLLIWQRFCSWLINSQLSIHSTRFNYPPPTHYEEYPPMFGEQLQFSQPSSGFSFSSKQLTLPRVRDPMELECFLRQSPLEVLRRVGENNSLSIQVQRLILNKGLEQAPALEEVACCLHMTSRTLRRKLKDEGVSYQQIKDRIRCDTAIRLLTEESLTVAETSELIGFTEQAAFCRAFKGWTGVAPSAYQSGKVEP
ncbi:AraC family transcriptional regulator [Amphritea balenae]|uniref:AraC family transcriptional regulator n=1 Tax=Amphritea balenae TaxID=452629 RepID=A0A3P1SPK8_9GAMM|nr:AraC family transcriptional regulator [Amphritea balenae]RRC98904.1 AraC family transcriptional regulator [Amphritea balenae]GGK62786.1 AraC family transcriptional regulator [Amphritea balenae]